MLENFKKKLEATLKSRAWGEGQLHSNKCRSRLVGLVSQIKLCQSLMELTPVEKGELHV